MALRNERRDIGAHFVGHALRDRFAVEDHRSILREAPGTKLSAMLSRIQARIDRVLAPPRSSLVPFVVDGEEAGRVTRDRAQRLARFADVFAVTPHGVQFQPALADRASRTGAIADVARALSGEGALTAWRNELFAVAPAFAATPWFELERSAARYFGIRTYAAHVNGLVRRGATILMWIARRSATKSIDPNLLDNLVGGGIASGVSIAETVIKEAWEEAGVARGIAAAAQPVGESTVIREQRDGIQHETVFMHDLWLDPAFVPSNQDGEAVEHRLLPLHEVAQVLAGDEMTVDATIVALDCLRRLGAV
jgi:8-oxo-dGTP pyrophosphatase MutT (NUDIX family)